MLRTPDLTFSKFILYVLVLFQVCGAEKLHTLDASHYQTYKLGCFSAAVSFTVTVLETCLKNLRET